MDNSGHAVTHVTRMHFKPVEHFKPHKPTRDPLPPPLGFSDLGWHVLDELPHAFELPLAEQRPQDGMVDVAGDPGLRVHHLILILTVALTDFGTPFLLLLANRLLF